MQEHVIMLSKRDALQIEPGARWLADVCARLCRHRRVRVLGALQGSQRVCRMQKDCLKQCGLRLIL